MAQKDSQRLSKQERREAARAEAARLREEQERRDKRNKMLFLGGGLVLLALVVVAAVMIVMNGNKSALDGVDRPEGSDLQGGIPVSSELVAGKDDGTVRVDLYSDYTCTHCNNLEHINGEDLEALMSEGTATIWFHPVATMDGSGNFSGYSGLATNAIATVAHHAPETFLEANSALFDLYWDAVESGATVAPGLPEIEAALTEAGVPADVVARLADSEYLEWTQATTRQFGRDGYRGTPVLEINDEEFGGWSEPGALRAAVEAAAG